MPLLLWNHSREPTLVIHPRKETRETKTKELFETVSFAFRSLFFFFVYSFPIENFLCSVCVLCSMFSIFYFHLHKIKMCIHHYEYCISYCPNAFASRSQRQKKKIVAHETKTLISVFVSASFAFIFYFFYFSIATERQKKISFRLWLRHTVKHTYNKRRKQKR